MMKYKSALFLCALLMANCAAAQAWKTYKDKRYHFQIQYPPVVVLKHSFEPHYLIGKQWRYDAQGNGGKPIVSFSLASRMGIKGASIALRIGSSNVKSDLAACLKGSKESTMINDVKFSVFSYKDYAMSKALNVKSYRTIYHGRCYAIEQVLTYSTLSLGNKKSRTRIVSRLNQTYDDLSYIVKTFRFTGNSSR